MKTEFELERYDVKTLIEMGLAIDATQINQSNG